MRVLLISILIFSLCSCAPRRPAKVDEIGAKPHRTQTKSSARHPIRDNQYKTHQVVKGDSLYSIGFRYQKDYQTLAAINGISPPYRIYPGQVIKLTGQANKVLFKPTTSNPGVVQTKPMVNNQPITAKTEPVQNNKPAPQSVTEGNPIKQPPVAKPSNQPTPSKQPAKKPMVVVTPNKTDLKWLWPTNGKIRTTFLASNPARKGISIGGQEGQAVKAAEAGVVVYSGNGLLGYGELIIIKHNDAYLSAYGHNKTLKVKEGQTVNRGETIAELGSTGTNVNNLHFEIRKNGKPVNPLNYVKP